MLVDVELEINLPSNYSTERIYIIDTIFTYFFGIKYRIIFHKNEHICIKYADKILVIKDQFFQTPNKIWLQTGSLPKIPVISINTDKLSFPVIASKNMLPIIFGEPSVYIEDKLAKVDIDIFGSCFYMLSRYEEYVIRTHDSFGRFSSEYSTAYRAGFLHRPIVNEYVELLWSVMHCLWPDLKRKRRNFKVIPTHDVDRPFAYANLSYRRMLLNFAEDMLLRRKPRSGVDRLEKSIISKLTRGQRDPYNSFLYLMEQSEKRGLTSEFYFLTNVTNSAIDADYALEDKAIRDILRNIYSRNHIIGLHPSFDSYLNPIQISKELILLKNTCESLEIQQKKWGSRQHYLRWQSPETPKALEFSGVDYDSSLYYANVPGFRTGCCYEYALFDVLERRPLKLIERPLVLMDTSLIDEDSGSVNMDESKRIIGDLKANCKLFNGSFVLLWHNSNLVTEGSRELYEYALDC